MNHLLHLFTNSKEYYEELYEVFHKAEHSIFILGLDIHSEVDLMPHKKNLETSSVLVNLLRKLALENKELQIYLLQWEYALLYAVERDPLLNIKFSFSYAPYHDNQIRCSGPIVAEFKKIL